jgi:hypothetical protein
MPAIANYPDRVELLNLGYGPGGKGPYVLRQEGNEPGSLDLRQNTYLLRKDGVWVLNLAILALPESEQEVVLYPTVVDAMNMMTGLAGGDPVIDAKLPAGRTLEEMQAAAESTASRLLSRMRQAKREPLGPPTA